MHDEEGSTFDLPENILHVLPRDPYEQLDVARKITSMALWTRVSELESESSVLLAKLADKDSVIGDLQSRLESLDASLTQTRQKLAQTELEKESLLKENESLSLVVKKLSRDVAKLEFFRKTLMQSLQEAEESSLTRAALPIIAKPTPSEDDGLSHSSRSSSVQSRLSEMGNTTPDDDHELEGSRPSIAPHVLLTTQSPQLTPPGSPPLCLSAPISPINLSNPVSPRRNSLSFATSGGMMEDDKSSVFSCTSCRSSASGVEMGNPAGRADRTGGREFLRRVRTRLSYEQFAAFLANVKELNSRHQTREETLQKAVEIFGPENQDLYEIFEKLVTRKAQ